LSGDRCKKRWNTSRCQVCKISKFSGCLSIERLRYRAAHEEDRARSLYKAFVKERIGAELETLDAHPLERRVLGDDSFLNKLSIPTLKRLPKRTLEDVIAEICATHNVTDAQLRSSNQHRKLTQAVS